MIRLDAPRGVRFCDGLTRRDFLYAGALPALGLGLSHLFLPRAMAEKPNRPDKDVNCIFIVLVGGPSQHETFDPKPDAPAEIRGPFKPIDTAVKGMRISELFPKLAKQADKFSIVRTMHHSATAVHDTGYQLMQSGRLFTGGLEHPHIGSVLGYLKGGRGELPAHVLLPRPIGRTGGNLPHGHTAGYLGKPHDPFILNADPSVPNFKVPDLLPPDDITVQRAERRQRLRQAVESGLDQFEKSASTKQLDDSFTQAFRLMSSKAARAAFDLQLEPTAMREKYGKTRFGQSCLMARRLIEAGVRFVTINMFETVFDEVTWDIHGSRPFTDINEMAKQVTPNFDQAYSTLLQDLQDRGLLENTMVVATGEFGRTPKINPAGGRDHHPGVWSLLMGGGPLKNGIVVGESDAQAHAPKTKPISTIEFAATLYQGLGIDYHTELPGPQGRPIPLTNFDTKPIPELI